MTSVAPARKGDVLGGGNVWLESLSKTKGGSRNPTTKIELFRCIVDLATTASPLMLVPKFVLNVCV